jgi:hypothetical protein
MARIIIPSNKDKLIQLSKSILVKHAELGDASPLKGLKVTEWTVNTTAADVEKKNDGSP